MTGITWEEFKNIYKKDKKQFPQFKKKPKWKVKAYPNKEETPEDRWREFLK